METHGGAKQQKKMATVMRNSHIVLNKHYYSIPKEYIGKTVEIVYDNDTIEVYHNLKLVTTHQRDDTPFGYTQKPAHDLPSRQSDYAYKLENLYALAGEIDPDVEKYIKRVAQDKKYPERAFRSRNGILDTLANKYGKDRLVDACRLALELNAWGYNELLEILSQNEDIKYRAYYDGEAPQNTPKHKNLRGKNYFKNNNDDGNK